MRESEEIVLLREQEEGFDDDEEEEEEEEALSLCDLPINNEEKNQTAKKDDYGSTIELAQDQDFDFSFCGGNLLTESEMCTADQVFYQGQILPLRHSISFPSDRSRQIQNLNLIRSESMDHCGDTNSSSRSSSIRSQRSCSSGSSSNFSTKLSSNYKPKIRNQFHSHPSPTPQVRFNVHNINNVNSSRNKSTLWSLFRVGLVMTTPEIALQDLKTRSKEHFGSRNSTGSSSSNSNHDNKMRIIKKQRFFLGGSCKCRASAVAETTTTKTRKAVREHETQDDKKENVKGTKKQAMSRHRTFEWLKQLSLVDDET